MREDESLALSDVRRHYAELAPSYRSRANAACEREYADLVGRAFATSRRVLEIGAGASPRLARLTAPRRVACDASLPMLAAAAVPREWWQVAGDAQALPFADATFDGICAINLLEHVADPQRLAAEAARLLTPGGRLLAVTPNGDVEWLLDALEWLRVKLPEGPHRFLTTTGLAAWGTTRFRALEHRRFLALPLGPSGFVRWVDRAVGGRGGRGLFQYLLLERTACG